MLNMHPPVNPKRWRPLDLMRFTTNNESNSAVAVLDISRHHGIIFLTYAAKFSLHRTFACMPQAPSACPPLAALRTNQPRAQRIDAPDRFGRSLLVRPAELAGDRHRTDFAE